MQGSCLELSVEKKAKKNEWRNDRVSNRRNRALFSNVGTQTIMI